MIGRVTPPLRSGVPTVQGPKLREGETWRPKALVTHWQLSELLSFPAGVKDPPSPRQTKGEIPTVPGQHGTDTMGGWKHPPPPPHTHTTTPPSPPY